MFSISFLLLIFWITLTCLIFLGFLLIVTLKYRDQFYPYTEEPRVLVVLPCRGVDHRFEENLKSLQSLNYENYSIVAIVDSMRDKAVKYLKKYGFRIEKSSSKCDTCSGKVRALSTAFENNTEYDIYAVVDSDAQVGRNWLAKLVGPLTRPSVGVSTTFPIFVPDGGFWSVIKSVWGMVGTGMMQSKITRFIWGGSMAFRTDLLDKESLQEFKRMVSDDVAIMRLCKSKDKEVVYVKEAAPYIYSPDDFNSFFEWANRQTALSIYGSNSILKYGISYYSLQIFLFISSICLAIFVFWPLIFLMLPMVITAFKNSRNTPVRKLPVFLSTFLIPFLYVTNLLIASRMKSINWRGKIYKLN